MVSAAVAIAQWRGAKYLPVGFCIYCGAMSELSDEHIIPFALLPKGGDWYLPKASCASCADITKRFEGVVCGAMFGALREKMGLKSRRRKRGVTTARYANPDGSVIDIETPIDNFPTICIGFKWPLPAIIRNGSRIETEFTGELIARYDEGLKLHIAPDRAFRIARVSHVDFARMLAKIAHAWAIAQYGVDSFEPLLQPIILGQSRRAPYLIGGDNSEVTAQPGVLHQIYRVDSQLEGAPPFFGVAIRLFALLDMPRYYIVVGRRLKEFRMAEKTSDANVI